MPPSIRPLAPACSFTPETVLATLSSYSNDWRLALDFFHYVSSPPHSFPHTPKTLTLTIDILGKHLEFPRALSLLPPSPPLPALRSLFNRLSAARLLPDALSLFRSSSPSPATYHLLLDALCEHRHVDEAQSLALSPSPPFPADTKVHNLILRGWLTVRSFRRVREFWLDMDRKSIPKDLHSYTIYMDALVKSNKPYKALKLHKHLTQTSSLALDVVAYNTLIQAAALAGGADRAVRMYREMLDSGLRPNVPTFNALIKAFCGEGRAREGYALVDQMGKYGLEPDVITYHCFFRHSTRPQEIMRLFERMLAGGCRPRTDTYVMLMKKFGRWGFLRPVFAVWERMGEHGVSPDAFAYNALIDALLQKGMVEMARKYDEEMLAKGLSAKPRKELGTKGLGDMVSMDDRNNDDDNAMCGVF
ncbi:uncharacterized protein M6B38_354620 [Iris pallida]|uniref:Pentatricopeptide repeat-containing protein n=1 Tax=Iris pallida TaxID=29817 RepID=A0AAX6GPM7_IRIPA|nr:uncharacterized protein M6B38_354620 [Iris pallida]